MEGAIGGTTVEGTSEVVARFGAIGAGLKGDLATAINEGALLVETTAKVLVHKKTTNLENHIHTIPATATTLQARVMASTSYAWYVEKGAAPHIIVPNKAKVLAFTWENQGDADVVTMSVNHPGSPPFPYLEPALTGHADDIQASIMLSLQMAFLQ
ncbi:MAG: hypothetical protein ABSC64_02235 [Candidatus Korobacteraceae bacterium]|jgi:hypothetical protein